MFCHLVTPHHDLILQLRALLQIMRTSLNMVLLDMLIYTVGYILK